ncbi:hypothetical protein niasHS_001047 [Heterodera schachtii]|uniref:Bromo domain-containing protein n=1 Tax=Heterodera schachtii TaxID=97005 RepID=A0ABD2K838_HETSC
MKGTTRRKHRQPSLQDDSGSNNGGKTTPVPTAATAAGPPEEWRLEAAIVSLLTLTDGDNRLICPPFRVLPTPTEFPLYYEHITNPIDLKCIAERARAGHYTDWAAIEVDIQLLCQNTKDFSESGQMLRKDADLLLDHFKSRASEVAGARRFSARVLARNKEYIDELLRSTASEVGEYSEDSEEDEDSERSNDPAWRLYWTIRNFDVVDGVPLCENFMELPSKTSYPDYYEEIPHPMSLYMINKKLKRGQYNGGGAADGGGGTAAAPKQQHNQQLHGLVKDLLLMFDNACAYNIEESAIFEAAERLRKLTLQTVKKLDSTYKTNTSQKAIKQEVLDDDDIDEEENGEQQQQPHQNHSHPSPPPIVPKMNGTSAVVPPPAKRRKVGPKGGGGGGVVVVDGAANAAITTNSSINATTDVPPVRRVVKREASAKGEQAIKRMVDSDFEEEEEYPVNDHHHHHKQRTGMQNNHRHQPNNLKNGDISAAVPSSSSSTTTAPPVGTTAAACANASSSVSHKRAPRRLNADGTPAERLKPGRKSVDELREKFAQKLTAIWQDVHNLKMGDRALAEPFEYLPCDKTFPDYYRTITKPISLMCIQRKIKEQLYADSDELLADLRQMFANARTFNKPDAQICADATILESVAVGSMRTHTEGVTLFYPYRRTDKGWSEKASIERSPLKMKRKGAILSTAPPTAASSSSSLSTNADGTNLSSVPSTTAATATTAGGTSSTATATISSATATTDSQSATTPSAICAQQQRSLAAASLSAVYVAPPLPPSSVCQTLNNNNNNAIASTSGAVYYAAGGGYLVPQQQQQFILHHHNAMPMAQAQPPQQFAAPHSVVHVQQQQQYLHQQHQQPMALATSVKQLQQQQQYHQSQQQQQQYFSSTSALINGGGIPPNAAALQQVLHNGPIAAAVASSSCSASSSSSTVGPTVLFHLQQPQQQQHHAQAVQPQYIQHHYGTNAESCAVGVHSSSPYSAGTVGLVGTNTSSAQSQVQQMIIDPGRAVVNAMPKMALPVFVEPSASVKIQRVLHSEAYVRYIESMYSNKVQRTVSKWDKNLQATQRNTTAMPSSSASSSAVSSSATTTASVFFDAINTSNGIDGKNRKQLAHQWIRLSSSGSRRREEVLMRALWTLRDQLIEGTVGVARHAELPPGEPPTKTTTAAVPSSSSKNDRNNNNNNNHNNSSARTGGVGCSSWTGPSCSSSSSAVAAAAEKR